jgi:hypothetical protein
MSYIQDIRRRRWREVIGQSVAAFFIVLFITFALCQWIQPSWVFSGASHWGPATMNTWACTWTALAAGAIACCGVVGMHMTRQAWLWK